MEPNPSPQNTEVPPTTGPGQVITPGASVAPATVATPPLMANNLPTDRPVAVAGGNPAVPGSQPPLPQSPSPKRFKGLFKKKLLLPLVIVLVLLGGSAAAYFGYYVPNQPENLWATALTRTGKGYDKLTQYSTDQFKNSTGLKLDGKFQTSGFLAADGTITGDSDKDNGEFTGTLSTGGVKVNVDLRLIKSNTSTPDVYFKIEGIQGLGDLVGSFVGPQYKSAINGLNGKWYFVDHSLFDQFSSGNGNNLQVTSEDVSSVLKAIGDASKQNVFTNDPSKMAFTIKSKVGKEKQDGRNTYHYIAGINKENLKNYVTALCDNLKNSNLKKFFNGDTSQTSSAIGCDTATQSVANFNSNRTADVWVDLHTKLIHKVRITDTKNQNNYFEISQDYQGGNVFPFALNFHSKDSDFTNDSNVNLTLDTKANTLNFKVQSKDTGSDNFSASAEFTVAPHSGKVTVQKPANAETIIQLFNDLGLGDIVNGQIQSNAADTKRKTDINVLTSQAEVYWANNGFYPTFAEFNDPTWRAANMKGFDNNALKDPAGSSTTLSAKPGAHVYAYAPTPAGCDNIKIQCTDYTLTATLDDGSTYVKQSLNSTDTQQPSLLQ